MTLAPTRCTMHYSRVYLESIGYELAPVVVSTCVNGQMVFRRRSWMVTRVTRACI